MLCKQQRTSRQAGSCTEALKTWLFNFNMQQGQADRVWEWLDHAQRKSGKAKGKGAATGKCREVLVRRGHIGCIFNISLTFCCEHWAIWAESTPKHLKSSSWKQPRPDSRSLIPVTATWTQESCGSLSLWENPYLQWCNEQVSAPWFPGPGERSCQGPDSGPSEGWKFRIKSLKAAEPH